MWSKHDLQILNDNYRQLGPRKMTRLLPKYSVSAITNKAYHIGIGYQRLKDEAGPLNISEIDKAYLAGIIDGEGHIGIRIRDKLLSLCIQITNTDAQLIEWIRKRLEGIRMYVNKVDSFDKGHFGKKTVWIIKIYQTLSIKMLLDALLPYLIVKRKKAELVLRAIDKKLTINEPLNPIEQMSNRHALVET